MFATAAATLDVTFDAQLEPGPVDRPNWAIVADNFVWSGAAAASASGRTVTVSMLQGFPNPAGDNVIFTPPPFDVVSRFDGTPVLAFAGFPLTVLP